MCKITFKKKKKLYLHKLYQHNHEKNNYYSSIAGNV